MDVQHGFYCKYAQHAGDADIRLTTLLVFMVGHTNVVLLFDRQCNHSEYVRTCPVSLL